MVMIVRTHLLVGLFSALVLTTRLLPSAQAQERPPVNEAGACPDQATLERLNPALASGSAVDLQKRIGSPARANIPLYRSPALADPKVQTTPLGYDDDVEVLLGTVLGQDGPALVRRSRDRICGWLNAREIQQSSEPLLLIQVPGFNAELDRRKLPNELRARIIVKNRLDRNTGYGQRAPLFQAPFDGPEPSEAERRGSLGYFEVLSVFEVRRANGNRCRIFNEEGCFLRVGSASQVRGSVVTRTNGWVLGKDVEIWPSALAVYYGRGKQGIKIHKTEPSARIGTPFADRGAVLDPLAFQPEGAFQEPKDVNVIRFPVIRGTPYGATIPPRPGADPPSYVYEVVFSGQACIEGNQGCIPEPQVKQEVARLGLTVKRASNIDVLFVVDATESMGPYFKAVVAAIRARVNQVAAKGDLQLRYSIALYGDYNEKVNGGLDFYAIPFSQANDLTGLDRLQSAGSFEDIHKDKPEAPFAALERAIATANWTSEGSQRLVIWIGDHGNRKLGTHRTNGGFDVTEERSANHVTAAIKNIDDRFRNLAVNQGTLASGAAGSKTRFVALQVLGGGGRAATQDDYFKKFREDADAISSALGERVFKTIPAASNMNVQAEVDALAQKIGDQILQNIDATAAVRDAVAGALSGDMSKLQSGGAPPALLARDFLTQMGFSPEKLAELGRRIQLVRNGFVYQSGGRDPDLRYWLGVRRPEFNDIRSRATALCENLRYSDRIGYVEESIEKLIKSVTFSDRRPNETMKEFYARIFSVPAERISTMLEGTPEEFLRRWRGDRTATAMTTTETAAQFQNRVLSGVCRSAFLLSMVGNNQAVENPGQDIIFSNNQAQVRPTVSPKAFDWRWISSDARSEWFFVPLEYLP
ncbi:VWA domain-containing protein [Bradyrhizobium sp. 83002]|uniref:VWA domain-containing protein n=1 Tax=Bradyrhizobium aeschynomenes TaxID=2734909 RepID=UPI00155727AC|nr:VWA domain-containing protein [Bradyrhizobium aeschynomenes]NPU13068.1 VWA domain-containing protein [Bradyrhizobium aeschynomenes]